MAVGAAPHAHLTIYKASDDIACVEVDILAALDVTVEDGVDVLSISLGSITPVSFLSIQIQLPLVHSKQPRTEFSSAIRPGIVVVIAELYQTKLLGYSLSEQAALTEI